MIWPEYEYAPDGGRKFLIPRVNWNFIVRATLALGELPLDPPVHWRHRDLARQARRQKQRKGDK